MEFFETIVFIFIGGMFLYAVSNATFAAYFRAKERFVDRLAAKLKKGSEE